VVDRRSTDQRLALPRPIPVLDSSREIDERDTDRRAVVGFERQRTVQRIDTTSELSESESAAVLEGGLGAGRQRFEFDRRNTGTVVADRDAAPVGRSPRRSTDPPFGALRATRFRP
jgi:hypothetical protein